MVAAGEILEGRRRSDRAYVTGVVGQVPVSSTVMTRLRRGCERPLTKVGEQREETTPVRLLLTLAFEVLDRRLRASSSKRRLSAAEKGPS